ncbi:MAG: VWA domain-containing protein [Acidobacteria bacterium]|nr:VWA domain-containing protein [Acidobacteriota bacterium]
MRSPRHSVFRLFLLLFGAAVCATTLGAAAGQAPPPQKPRAVFRSAVDLVTVNVVVRDKNGTVVKGLKRDDFIVLEDGKPQTVDTFDFEEVDAADNPPPPSAIPTILGGVGKPLPAPLVGRPVVDMHDRRLVVLMFDLSSMAVEDTQRALDAARDYVNTKVGQADTVAIVTYASSLDVAQDFTSDKNVLLNTIDRLNGIEGMGFEEMVAVDPDATTDDTNGAFVADDTEFNMFNTDRRLQALRSMVDALSGIQQKKSLVYFSSGMNQTGMDNRVAMRGVIDRAVRTNLSIYSADMRGLQAVVPGGDASRASTRGVSAFNGRGVSSAFSSMSASQDALSSLAEDTGGRAFFDRNDFGGVFDRVIADTSAYYVLGYSSTNTSRDGRFRRVRIQLKRTDLKLEYRVGYYAQRDFTHSTKDDREQLLMEQLASDLSVTDLPVYASSAYFRLKGNHYYVPVWLVVPGSRVPFTKAGDKSKATLDVLGVLVDSRQIPVARMRDTVNLALGSTENTERKAVQYATSFELPPGTYRLKVVIRENQGGTMGSFETSLVVPDLDRSPVKISSVVLGSNLAAVSKKDDRNPLLRNGQELVANVARVIPSDQHLYFYYEMYDPAQAPAPPADRQPGAPPSAAPAAASPAERPIRVLSSVTFFHGQQKAYETPLIEVPVLTSADRKAAAFQLDIPASELQPGLYTCQVNIVDDIAGTFAFPRMTLYIRK